MSDRQNTIQELRSWGRKQFEYITQDLKLNIDTVGLDVDLLLGEVLRVSREFLITHGENCVEEAPALKFRELIYRRCKSEPIAYILGKKEFFGLDFLVNPAVLIPRPETELIVQKALESINLNQGSLLLVDVGTGSGVIVLSILHEIRRMHGVKGLKKCSAFASDISGLALKVAQENAAKFGLSEYLTFVQSDLFEELLKRPGMLGEIQPDSFEFTLIVSNPPYIAQAEILPLSVSNYEPTLALRAGEEGLDIIQRLIEQVFQIFYQKFILLIEVGSTQADQVTSLLFKSSAKKIIWHKDLQGIDRMVEVSNLKE